MANTGCKILMVEDLEINRKLMREIFRRVKVSFEEAENGAVAVEYFRQGRNYDLVLMDKDMPIMDGHEATRQLRSMGFKIPIIALTAEGNAEEVIEFLRAGADDFHTKPLTVGVLKRMLEEYGLQAKKNKSGQSSNIQ